MSDLGLLRYPVNITNDYQRDELCKKIGKLETSRQKPILVKITDVKEKRSNAINRLAHMWYRNCANQGGEYTEEQVKCISKLKWGVPIMRQHEKFNTTWMKLIAGFPTYEEQVELMQYLPVTSLMTNAEMSSYLTHFKNLMGQHYDLIDPKLEGIEL